MATMSYEGQKGTLEDISANYDYAVAYVNAAEIENGNITPNGPAKFVNQQASAVEVLSPMSITQPLNTQTRAITGHQRIAPTRIRKTPVLTMFGSVTPVVSTTPPELRDTATMRTDEAEESPSAWSAMQNRYSSHHTRV
ncbi:MAG: hypothetical protein II874_00335 [Bacteroidales bacterium]|nr:hypothetical protein [Bacteroidales bacterium]